jgi:hypothetical protein
MMNVKRRRRFLQRPLSCLDIADTTAFIDNLPN